MNAKHVTGLIDNRVGPFRGVQFDKQVTFVLPDESKRTFRVLTYQAYDAFGLVGSECNGIAVLDEDNKSVLCDEIGKQQTGWFGASQTQLDMAEGILNWDWVEFQEFINSHQRNRYQL